MTRNEMQHEMKQADGRERKQKKSLKTRKLYRFGRNIRNDSSNREQSLHINGDLWNAQLILQTWLKKDKAAAAEDEEEEDKAANEDESRSLRTRFASKRTAVGTAASHAHELQRVLSLFFLF